MRRALQTRTRKQHRTSRSVHETKGGLQARALSQSDVETTGTPSSAGVAWEVLVARAEGTRATKTRKREAADSLGVMKLLSDSIVALRRHTGLLSQRRPSARNAECQATGALWPQRQRALCERGVAETGGRTKARGGHAIGRTGGDGSRPCATQSVGRTCRAAAWAGLGNVRDAHLPRLLLLGMNDIIAVFGPVHMRTAKWEIIGRGVRENHAARGGERGSPRGHHRGILES